MDGDSDTPSLGVPAVPSNEFLLSAEAEAKAVSKRRYPLFLTASLFPLSSRFSYVVIGCASMHSVCWWTRQQSTCINVGGSAVSTLSTIFGIAWARLIRGQATAAKLNASASMPLYQDCLKIPHQM